jgi:hypothetical protein
MQRLAFVSLLVSTLGAGGCFLFSSSSVRAQRETETPGSGAIDARPAPFASPGRLDELSVIGLRGTNAAGFSSFAALRVTESARQ